MTPVLQAWVDAAKYERRTATGVETATGFRVDLWDSGTVGDDFTWKFPGATRDEAINRAERWAQCNTA